MRTPFGQKPVPIDNATAFTASPSTVAANFGIARTLAAAVVRGTLL
jgi:hypothetical protein